MYESILLLVPELDLTVPASRGHLAGLVWVPEHADAHVIVRLPLGQKLGRLPVPDENLAVAVARREVGHLRREVYPASVACHHVTLKHLLPHLFESLSNLKTCNLN